ncbi:site-specific recombinase XerD [Mesonia algae]|uniref:Site-specific recombinase XerD n=3 Tax=Mesonia TaxID=232115 RepID=A0A2W7IVJ8_9FLAO|nr:site-specific integrase [Mesonia algae]PZW42713.1 site-specific recombinase XerD [Mesonia algae]
MRTNQTYSVSFFIRKKKKQPQLAALYSRITVNGRSLELSLKRTIPSEKWDSVKNRYKGNSEEAKIINAKIQGNHSKLLSIYDELIKEDKIITAQLVKARYLGTDQKHKSLTDLLTYHNTNMVNVLSHGTLKNYFTTTKYLLSFLSTQYKTSNIFLKQIDYKFLIDFETYLRSQPDLHNNGVMKHIERFKKVMRLAMDLEWIDKNPTSRFKLRFEPVDMVYLTQGELEKIQLSTFEKKGIELTKDIFVFACYTGLSYMDVKKLTWNHIHSPDQKQQWIYTKRQKTNTSVRIPLLPEAEAIILKYQQGAKNSITENLLPIYSNQKTNQYLKVIAKKLKIRKKLSFHTARHTFATSVTLENGVPIETVSKLLGHHKIATTQIYARVVDKKIANDMEALKNKLGRKKETTLT